MRRGIIVTFLTAACALMLALPAGAVHKASARPQVHLSALESQVLGQVNAIRARRGLRQLRISAGLSAAAAQHSREMAEDGYFAHESANGGAFWRRIQRFYGMGRYHSWQVGENLLWSSPDVDAAAALRMWLASPEHRANLLNGKWREIGVSAVHVESAPGAYHGLPVTIVTADFGARD